MTSESGRTDEIQVGDWVQVYAQRVATPRENEHPEEWVVRVQSHNADVLVDVRRDWTVKCVPPERVASRCPHLNQWPLDTDGEYLIKRCSLHYNHAGQHTARAGGKTQMWDAKYSVGYMEDK